VATTIVVSIPEGRRPAHLNKKPPRLCFLKLPDYPITRLRGLPHSSLRWYRIRVEEARRDGREARPLSAHAAAERLTNRGFTNLMAALKHALGEAFFAIADAGGGPEKMATALIPVGHVLATLDRNDFAREKLQAEIDARAPSMEDEAAPVSREQYPEVAVDVLKRLRGYRLVREAIDPLKDVLIEEFSHAADSFAEQEAEEAQSLQPSLLARIIHCIRVSS
jgi:hypothetical protein